MGLHAGACTDRAPAVSSRAAGRRARSACMRAAHMHSLGITRGAQPNSYSRITGRAQFTIGTVPGYMHMKYRYTEFKYR